MSRRKANGLDRAIGQRLRQLREQRQVSQAGLAKAKGVRLTAGQVQKFEYGTNRIAVSRLIPILRALNVTITEFFAVFPETGDGRGGT